MTLRRCLLALLAASTAAGLLGPVAAARTDAAVTPSIYVDYDDDCVFTVHADGGFTLSSATAPGTTIPPGTYQVVLRVPEDAPSCPMRFQLVGPGVQLQWDFGGEAIGAQSTETLQPASTYVATDLRNPSRYRAVFSTAASGSSSSLAGERASTATGSGQSTHDLVGSAIAPYRGVLKVALGRSGALALTANGKAVTALRAGRYTVAVRDASSTRGLAVRKPGGQTSALTGRAFVGRRVIAVALTRGAWRFAAGGAHALRVAVVA